jgi:hypothetical protein
MSRQMEAAAAISGRWKPKLSQGLEDRVPIDMAATRDAAVILAGMNMLKALRSPGVPCGDVLLFDIGVEGIDQQPDAGVVDLIAESCAIRGGVEEVSLEAVQRLNRQRDVILFQGIAERMKAFDGALPFF